MLQPLHCTSIAFADKVAYPPVPGNKRLRCDLRQRHQHEAAMVRLGMRQRQALLIDPLILVCHQVQIDDAWPPVLYRTVTAESVLDRLQRAE